MDKLRKENQKLKRKLQTRAEKKAQKQKVQKLKAQIDRKVKDNAQKPLPSKKEREDQTVFGEGPAWKRYTQRFSTVRRKAKQKGEIPKVNYRLQKIASRTEVGKLRSLKIETLVRGNVYEIMVKVDASVRKMMKKARGIWLASFCMTAMGERLIGSGNYVSKAQDPDAHNLQIGFDSTGVQPSANALLEKLEDQLEDYASEKHTMVMIEWIKIRNFDWK